MMEFSMHTFLFSSGEDEEEILVMVIDEDQDSVDEKTEEKMEDVSKPLLSNEINDKKEIETIVV